MEGGGEQIVNEAAAFIVADILAGGTGGRGNAPQALPGDGLIGSELR